MAMEDTRERDMDEIKRKMKDLRDSIEKMDPDIKSDFQGILDDLGERVESMGRRMKETIKDSVDL